MKHFLLFIMLGMFLATAQKLNAQNIFPEGDFENGIENWDPKFRGDAKGTFTVSDVAANGSKAALIDVTSADPTLNKVKIISPKITEGLKDNASYRFSFSAKSDVEQNEFRIQFVTYDAAGTERYMSSPKDENDEYYKLTTEYKTYKYIGINREGFNASADFSLQCAKYVAKYYIDDIKIESIEGIEDGGFEEGDLSYAYSAGLTTTSGANATFALDAENANSGTYALKVDVTATSDTVSHVNIVKQENFFTEKLARYEFSFYAKSTGAADSVFSAVNFYDGQTTLLASENKGFQLTNDYQLYKMVFTVPDSIHSVRFRLNLGKQVSTIFIDDLNVVKLPPVSATKTEGQQFRCYPNPALNHLFVEGFEQNKPVEIINIAGIKVMETNVFGNRGRVDISVLGKGMYFVRSGENVAKFIVEK